MRVFIITTETFPKGLAATQRIRCYAKSIAELGYKCKVLCLNRCEDPATPLGNTETKGQLDGYSYQYMGKSTLVYRNWKNRLNQLFDTLKLVMMMLCTFEEGDKAIVYSYNSFMLKLVLLCSKVKRFKVYFELNEHPSVLSSLFGIKGENKQDLAIIKRKLTGLDGILCISQALKELLIRSGIAEEKVQVVNMLVDQSRFKGLQKKETEPYIGYCGAADNNKDGVDRLIKAFSKIASSYPKLKLYIMGPKIASCKNEELSKSLGIENRVIFTGMINPDDMPQMLVNATVLALARPESIQAKYGFPTKLGEYLLTANPVVVTAVGDIPLFLKDGVSAYLSEPDNVEVFAGKLRDALSSEAQQIGYKGRAVAENFFSYGKVKIQLQSAMNLNRV